MISLPVIESIDTISDDALNLFKQYGFCYLKLEPQHANELEQFAQQSKAFFHQEEALKLQHPFNEQAGGYMSNIDKDGAYVERYSYRDAALPEIIGDKKAFDHLKQYLQHEVAEKFLHAVFKKECYLQHFAEVIKDLHTPMSFVYYPKQHPQDKPIGLAPHKDTGLITLLLINQPGLEVNISGQWRAVAPKPGYIVINAGVCLELMTGGDYQAILHRVTFEALANKERVSIPLFLGPNPNIPIVNYKNGETLYSDYLTMANARLDEFFPTDKNKLRS